MSAHELRGERRHGGKFQSVESLGRAFEDAWRASPDPTLSRFLPPPEHPLFDTALSQLVAIDLDWQWRSAHPVFLEKYLDEWPGLQTDPSAVSKLLRHECLARAVFHALPTKDELERRFPGRAIDLEAVEREAELIRQERSYLGSGRFFLLREVGRGNMGIVHSALDRQRNQVVALKTLPEAEPERLYYFKQEFRRLTAISHDRLAAPHELFSIGNQWFFTMDLIDGVDLVKFVRQPPSFLTAQTPDTPTAEFDPGKPAAAHEIEFTAAHGESFELLKPCYIRIRRFLEELVEALTALHRCGVLHRDLKPSNAMMRKEGGLVILDFGLSTSLIDPPDRDRPSRSAEMSFATSTSDSTDRRRAGTVPYMSPEQMSGDDLTEASDWYSVGVMLFLMLTGRLPFKGSWVEIEWQKNHCGPFDPVALNSETPADLREICLGLIERDPGRRWNGDRILRRLGGASTPLHAGDSPFLPAQVPFVGRAEQLEQLETAYREMLEGGTVCVHVCGPSGAGKSRLVSQLLRTLPGNDRTIVLAGRCYEGESVPFKGLDAVIDSLARYLRLLSPREVRALLPTRVDALARMFPVLLRVDAIAAAADREGDIPDPHQMRRLAFRAFRKLMDRLGNHAPVVLTIDDLQWGDVDSASALAELLRPPQTPRLMLIAVYRSEARPGNRCLDALTVAESADSGVRHRDIQVGPLSFEESRAIADRLLGSEAAEGQRADAIAHQAQGSPYFIVEMAEHARATSQPGEQSDVPLPDLATVLQRRVERLPEASRELLQVVAVAGQPLKLRTAIDAAQLATSDYARVSALRSQHLLRTDGVGLEDAVSTFHDRIRESIVARLPEDRLAALHGRLASSLERFQTADAEQIAGHYDAAGNAERAGRYYSEAAEAADRQLAFDRAARLYQRCFELLSLGPAERRSLLTKWGDALANAGRGFESAQRYSMAVEGAEETETFELRRRAAHQFCISGHVDHGREALGKLLAAIGQSLPKNPVQSLVSLLVHRGRLRWRGTAAMLRPIDQINPATLHRIDVVWTASAGLSMFDVLAGAMFQTQGCLLALDAGEPFRLSRALAWEAAHLSNIGGKTWERVQSLLSDARQFASGVTDPYAEGWITLCDGIANFTNGKWEAAETQLGRAEEVLRQRCNGVAWELDTAHAFSLWSLLYRGKLAEMQRAAAQQLTEARERGDLYGVTTCSAFSFPMGLLASGQPEAARRTILEALQQWTQAGFHVQHIVALMCGTYVDLYCGDGDSAWQRMQEQWKKAKASQLLRVQVLRGFLTHLRGRAALACAAKTTSRGGLLRAARADAKRVLGEKMPYFTPHGQHLLAGAAALEGDRDGAIGLFQEASAGYQQADMAAFASATRCRLGELKGGDEGKRMIAEAHEFFSGQGVQDVPRMIDAFAVASGV